VSYARTPRSMGEDLNRQKDGSLTVACTYAALSRHAHYLSAMYATYQVLLPGSEGLSSFAIYLTRKDRRLDGIRDSIDYPARDKSR